MGWNLPKIELKGLFQAVLKSFNIFVLFVFGAFIYLINFFSGIMDIGQYFLPIFIAFFSITGICFVFYFKHPNDYPAKLKYKDQTGREIAMNNPPQYIYQQLLIFFAQDKSYPTETTAPSGLINGAPNPTDTLNIRMLTPEESTEIAKNELEKVISDFKAQIDPLISK